MFDRSRTRSRRGHGTLVILFATLLAALSMFFASAVDVGAMLTTAEAASASSAAAVTPIEIPPEWVWRGREPVSLEFMYGNHEPPQQDWIRASRGH